MAVCVIVSTQYGWLLRLERGLMVYAEVGYRSRAVGGARVGRTLVICGRSLCGPSSLFDRVLCLEKQSDKSESQRVAKRKKFVDAAKNRGSGCNCGSHKGQLNQSLLTYVVWL